MAVATKGAGLVFASGKEVGRRQLRRGHLRPDHFEVIPSTGQPFGGSGLEQCSREGLGSSSSLAYSVYSAWWFGGRAPFRFVSAFRLASVNCLFDLVVRVAALHLSDPFLLHTPQFV